MRTKDEEYRREKRGRDGGRDNLQSRMRGETKGWRASERERGGRL